MLGTNDTKAYFARTPQWFELTSAGGHDTSARLGEAYRALTTFLGVPFFDAGSVISTDGVDGVHFTEDNNAALGKALAPVIRRLLENS